MNDEEVRRVHVNVCLRDAELREARDLCDGAAPGEWRSVVEAVSGMVTYSRVARHDGELVMDPASVTFMAKARGLVPRLLRGVEVLEEALRTAWAEAASWKRECIQERTRYEQDLARAAQGQTGPERDLVELCELATLGAIRPEMMVREVKKWAAGASEQSGSYRHDLDSARKRAAEKDRIRAEVEAEIHRLRAQAAAFLDELKLTKREKDGIASRVAERVKAGTG